MITRRGLLASSAAALLSGTIDANAQDTPRTPPRVRVIDVHAHWYPPEWIALLEREGDANGAKMGRNHARQRQDRDPRPHSACSSRNTSTSRPASKAMDKAGVAMHALSLTQPMAFWAPPAFGLKLCQTYNDACVAVSQKHPDRFVGLAMLPMQDPGSGGAGIRPGRAGSPASAASTWRPTSTAGTSTTRSFWPVYARCEEARPADPAAPGEPGRRRPHAQLPPAQLHRQSDREAPSQPPR